MFGTITKGGPADLAKAIGAQEDAPYLGFRVPLAADCKFTFRDIHFDDHRQCNVEHTTRTGVRLRAAVVQRDVRFMLASERMRLDHALSVAALRELQAGIEAHNAVVLPIDNGPKDRVAFAEALTRLRLAHEDHGCTRSREAHHECLNALDALTRLPIPNYLPVPTS